MRLDDLPHPRLAKRSGHIGHVAMREVVEVLEKAARPRRPPRTRRGRKADRQVRGSDLHAHHPPPHVHVAKAGAVLKIDLATGQ